MLCQVWLERLHSSYSKPFLQQTWQHDIVTVNQHAQYQNPETKAAKQNSSIINFINDTWAAVE